MKKELEDLLEKLKEQHREVYVITVGDDEQSLMYGFFRKPTFNELRMIYPLMQKGDDLTADKRLLASCWLGGDNEIYDVDNNLDIFLSVRGELAQLIELPKSSLDKVSNNIKDKQDEERIRRFIETIKRATQRCLYHNCWRR